MMTSGLVVVDRGIAGSLGLSHRSRVRGTDVLAVAERRTIRASSSARTRSTRGAQAAWRGAGAVVRRNAEHTFDGRRVPVLPLARLGLADAADRSVPEPRDPLARTNEDRCT